MRIPSIALLLVFVFSHVANAIQLKEPQSMPVEAGSDWEYNLKDEVTHSVTNDLEFTIVDAPGWVRLSGNRLTGTPPAKTLGPVIIRYRVRERKLTTGPQDGNVVLNVFATPVLIPEFDLGPMEERKKFEVSVRQKTRHPDLDTLAFRVHPKDQIPGWLKLSPDGVLSGTPQRPDISSKIDFRIQVTSNYGGRTETRVRGRVTKVPVATRWKKKEFELPQAKEDSNYRAQINPLEMVDNPENARLRFRLLDTQAWFEVSGDGAFRGTPRRKDLAKKSWEIEFEASVDGQVFKETAKFYIPIERTNKPPEWKSQLVQLPKAASSQKYEFKELAQQVTDIDQDKLQFEIVPGSGPDWLTISPDGTVRATIQPTFAGTQRWKVNVSDGKLSAQTRLELNVENHPPVWKNLPALPEAPQSVAYSVDLKPYVEDPDKDPLTFEASRLPPFLKLQGTTLVGTPEREHVGIHPVRVKATDGQASSALETTLKVTLKAYPPEVAATELKFRMKERAQLQIGLSEKRYVKDPNEDPLKFKWEGKPPPWAALTEAGALTLTPQLAQVGQQTLNVQVTDGKFNVPMNISVEVQRDPRAPEWNKEAIAFKTRAREPFTANISKSARDLDNLPVTYRKKSGPSWLQVAPTGELSGTPMDTAMGKNPFLLVADNGLVTSEKAMEIDVDFKNHPPEIKPDGLVIAMKERQTQTIDLRLPRYTIDPDAADTRTFTLDKAWDWIQLNPAGPMTLAPTFKQIGKHTVGFVVSDGRDKVKGEFQITVDRDARAPQWEKEDIAFNTVTRDPFRVDLTKHVKDADNLKITFQKRSGSELFALTPEGILTGQPKDDQVGEYTVKVTAANDVKESQARLLIKVTFKNTPPTWKQQVVQLPNGRANSFYSQEIAQYADDIDKFQNLRFSKVGGPQWVIIDPAGKLFGQPTPNESGKLSVQVKVDDGAGGNATATFQLSMESANSAPQIANGQDKIVLPAAYQGELFLFRLTPLFRDAQGDKLTFRKVLGPNWLRVNGTGEITGVPGTDVFGQFHAIFEVNDGHAGTQVKAQGLVKQP